MELILSFCFSNARMVKSVTITILISGISFSKELLWLLYQQPTKSQPGALKEKGVEMIFYQDQDVSLMVNADQWDAWMKSQEGNVLEFRITKSVGITKSAKTGSSVTQILKNAKDLEAKECFALKVLSTVKTDMFAEL